MQLYRTFYTAGNDDGAPAVEQCSWQGSLTEASKVRSALKASGHKEVGTQTVNVPTAKGPLLEWLNENVTTA